MRDLRTIFKNSDEVLPALELAFESIWLISARRSDEVCRCT